MTFGTEEIRDHFKKLEDRREKLYADSMDDLRQKYAKFRTGLIVSHGAAAIGTANALLRDVPEGAAIALKVCFFLAVLGFVFGSIAVASELTHVAAFHLRVILRTRLGKQKGSVVRVLVPRGHTTKRRIGALILQRSRSAAETSTYMTGLCLLTMVVIIVWTLPAVVLLL